MIIKDFIKSLFRKDIRSVNRISIDKECIINNFNLFKALHPSKTIIPVLKSNAYGHGIKQICSILDKIPNCHMVAVDSYPEYQIVVDNFDGEVLILSQTISDNYRYFNYRKTHFAVWDLQTLKSISQCGDDVKIHIFVNTGMNREGCSLDDLSNMIKYCSEHPHIKITWLMSHLACTDSLDDKTNEHQLEIFQKARSILWFYNIVPQYLHLSATGGLLKDIGGDIMTAGRLGIWLYWFNPLDKRDKCFDKWVSLKPALSLYSSITAIQKCHRGDMVGYGNMYEAIDDVYICTFGIGYFEALDRRLSDNRSIIYSYNFYPIVGRISMNYSAFQIPSGSHVELMSEVCIISNDISNINNIYNLAEKLWTIVYEPLVKLDSRIKRVVV